MKKLAVVTILAALLACGTAFGTVITIGPNCTTCQGSLYTIAFNLISGGVSTDRFGVTLTIDPSGYTGPGVAIGAVAPKISSSVVMPYPTIAPGGIDSWLLMSGGINAGGCDGSGSGFFCYSGVAVLTNSPITWGWNVIIPRGSLIDQPSLKVEYIDVTGNKVGALVSEEMSGSSAVPEPTSALLMGGGLLVLAELFRRKRPAK